MQQNLNPNQNSDNLNPQNPQVNPVNQTYVNAVPSNSTPDETVQKSENIKKIV